jgi:hypothetical protein
MRRQNAVRWVLASVASCLVLGASVPIAAQEVRPKDAPDGPAPSVEAQEAAATGPVQFHSSPDLPAAVPNHPPIQLIPPMPMPNTEEQGAVSTSSGPGKGILIDTRTRKTREFDPGFSVVKEGASMGGGYAGADGGSSVDESMLPATLSGPFSLISAASRATDPWRMNVKLVLRFGTSYFVCSGTMRDARTVLTAGHCVHQGGPTGNWADEIWVYPGWDGVGSIIPPDSITNPYGWAHSTALGSWSNWTSGGDITYDVGIVALDRAVGALTGWFGWSFGGSCAYWTSTTVNNASYPAESCGGGLHTGRDMYYWFGTFDSCPSDRRLGLVTVPGCLNAIWGGMSGSGVYIIDNGSRYVHGITSTSNRSTAATYQRQFQSWVEWNNDTFIPTYGRGAAFDLQPLDVNAGPSVIPAGGSTTLLNHLATNATNGTANGNWTYRVYLSTNDNIDPGDTLLSTQNYNWDFAALGSVTVNGVQVTIPESTPPGVYYLGVIYDNATDGNTSNNDTDGWDAVRITVTKPDLDITAISVPASAKPGDSFDVSNTVRNIGSAASGAFRVGLYYSVNNVCSTGDTFLASRTVASLGSGASSAAFTPVTIPASATPGTRYICAIADYAGLVAESNESNNSDFAAINIVQADLSVSVLSGPAKASPGGGISISNTVGNAGTAASGAFRMGLYLSTDSICTTGDVLIGSRAVASLAPGIASNANTAVTIPAGTALGAYFLCGIADDLGAVAESNEANNTRASAVNVVSATPIITLKVNGQHPTPPTVPVAGPMLLTLDVSPTTYSASVDWYWAVVYNGQILWRTPAGFSTTRAPWVSSPPVVLNNVTLLNLTLPPASTMTNVVFMVNGGAVVSADVITATRP